MVKITLIEDDLDDLRDYYATLNERHEVHVRFYVGRAQVPDERLSSLAES